MWFQLVLLNENPTPTFPYENCNVLKIEECRIERIINKWNFFEIERKLYLDIIRIVPSKIEAKENNIEKDEDLFKNKIV